MRLPGGMDPARLRTCLGGASDPAMVRLSHAKLRRFHPELYGFSGFLRGMAEILYTTHTYYTRLRMAEWLYHGDSRAAVVMAVRPLLVATYTDEIVCVAMLRFPDELAAEYQLRVGSCLLTANTYPMFRRHADLQEGPFAFRRYKAFHPLVVEFLTDDLQRAWQRKNQILPAEWDRTWTLACQYLARRQFPLRDGRPLQSGTTGVLNVW